MNNEVTEILKEKNNIVLITPYIKKIELLKSLENNSYLHRIKFFSKEELLEQLTYTAKKSAILEIMKEKKVIPELGKLLLEQIQKVTKKETQNPKVIELQTLEKKLKNKKLVIEHPLLETYLKNKKIIFYGYQKLEVKEIINHLETKNITYKIIEPIINDNKKIKVFHYEAIEEEVICVAEKITQLIKQGVSCNNIYLNTLSEDYITILPKILDMFHIPYQLQNRKTIFEYEITQTFLSLLKTNSNIEEVLEELKNKYPLENSFNQEIMNQIITLINEIPLTNYEWKDILSLITLELKQINVKNNKYENAVTETNIENLEITTNDHIFILGLNYGTYPKIYEDDDYLTDLEKQELGIITSTQRNECEKQKLLQILKNTENLYISYKLKTPFNEYLPSLIIEEQKESGHLEIIQGKYNYTNETYNKILLGKYLDDYMKYNVKHEMLDTLYENYPIPYANYQNQFTGINKEQLYQYLNNTCLLSYTTMDTFFKCKFRFYLNTILKIRPPYKETSSLIVGNLFHSILERYFQENKPKEQIIEEEIQKYKQEKTTKKEQFYFHKWEKEAVKLLNIIEEQLQKSDFENTYFEKNFNLSYQNKITFRITGKIDKIMTFTDQENTYVIVIDYKTGTASNNLNKVIYGMNMQLLLYLYFIYQTDTIKNPKFTGAYLQNIVKDIPNKEEGKTLEEIIYENNKWDGYSINRVDILKHVDHNLEENSFIKGVRLKKDGDFYQSNKILSEDTLEKLLDIVEQNIKIIMEAIEEADFKINPKRFLSDNGEVSSCAYCEYRDICYRNPKDIITLKEYKNLEFIKEEE